MNRDEWHRDIDEVSRELGCIKAVLRGEIPEDDPLAGDGPLTWGPMEVIETVQHAIEQLTRLHHGLVSGYIEQLSGEGPDE